jgi:DNA-binding response OmpR family regulator
MEPDPGPPQPELLVVDDEADLRRALARYFGFNNFAVRAAENAAVARALVQAKTPDLALIDINMPGESGLSLARWLRDSYPRMGLVMLTGASDSVDRIVGIEIGADDYITKPFEMREVLARLRALLRRLGPAPSPAAGSVAMVSGATGGPGPDGALPGLPFGQCRLDLEGRRLLGADGQAVEITSAEFDLLALFARHPDKPLNRDQIMEQGHRRGWDVFDRSIDLRVMRLRRKIEANPEKPEVLKTVRGVGYMYVTRPAP